MKPIRRHQLYSLLVILLASTLAGAQMRQVFPAINGSNNNVQKISFFSRNEGYVAFAKWIGYSTDSGHTFTQKFITWNNVDYGPYTTVNLTFGFGINGVKAFSRNNIVVYGNYGFVPAILYSQDGGNTFRLVYQSQLNQQKLTNGVTDMVFPGGGNIGYAAEADRIIKTTDGGKSWFVVRNSPNSFYDVIEAPDAQHIYAFSTDYAGRQLSASPDAGATWQELKLPQGTASHIFFLTAQKGWLSAGITIWYTDDGGINWQQKSAGSQVDPYGFKSMVFVNDSTGYGAGNYLYDIYKTTDSGKLWEPVPRDNTYQYLNYGHDKLFLYSSTQFWAGGGQGFIELNTNATGPVIPRAIFTIDTTGVSQSGTVRLFNHGKTSYSYLWYRNDTLISNSYNVSYNHYLYNPLDSIKLVAVNSNYSDSTTQGIEFTIPVDNAPHVLSFTPVAANTGTTITVKGSHFTGTSNVRFGGVAAGSYIILSDTVLTAKVGNGASGNVSVTTSYGTANQGGFTYLPPPAVLSFSPAAAGTGETVTITGNYFNGATAVRFGGVDASFFTVVSNTVITAVIASGSSGKITVSTGDGTGTVNGFVYTSMSPLITGFTPASGPVGTLVSISGINFSSNTGGNIVYFGPVRAEVVMATPTLLTVKLPAGATYSAIAVTAGGLTAWSSQPFALTYDGGGAIDNNTFEKSKQFPSGISPVETFMMDIDGDGKADMTSCNIFQSKFTILQNISVPGTVSFSTAQSFTAGIGLRAPAYGDLDGDGKPDLLLADYYGGNILLYKNNSTPGTISLNAAGSISNTQYPDFVTVGDIDADGRPDVVVGTDGNGSDFSHKFWVFRNTTVGGHISFSPRIELYGLTAPVRVWLGDFNGDGKPDIVSGSATGVPISVFRNTSTVGSISFDKAAGGGYEDQQGTKIGVGDLDGDGLPDVALGNYVSHQLFVYKNTSTRDSISFGAYVVYPCEEHNSSVTISDVDGDGKPDIIASNQSETVSVYKNTSSGGIISLQPSVNYAAGVTPIETAQAADVDGDGRPDIIVPNYTSNDVSVLRNAGRDTTYKLCASGSVILVSDKIGITYQWQQKTGTTFSNINNGVEFTGTNTNSLSISNITESFNGSRFRCLANGTASRTFTLLVDTVSTPSVKIVTGDTLPCTGGNVIIVAQLQNGGTQPAISWFINDVLSNATGNSFYSNTLPDSAVVKAVMVSTLPCQSVHSVTSNSITIHHKPTVAPLVSIALSDTVICPNATAHFHATSLNGGPTPLYHWSVDGREDNSTYGPDFIAVGLTNGNKVKVTLESSDPCALPLISTSNTIQVNVVSVTPTIIVSGNTVLKKGETTTLTTAITGGGSIPIYQWQDSTGSGNWQNISGSTSTTITYTPAATGDKIRCLLSSSALCANPLKINSNALIFTVNTITAIGAVPAATYGIRYYPNPVTTMLTIDSLQLSDQWQRLEIISSTGQISLGNNTIANQLTINIFTAGLSKGIYTVLLWRKKEKPVYFKIVKL